jgi:hypothetical protein
VGELLVEQRASECEETNEEGLISREREIEREGRWMRGR